MAKKAVENKSYFDDATKLVTRGELVDVLQQVLGQVDDQLRLSFEHVVEVSNLVDVMTQALVLKGLICDEDLVKAKETLIEASSKLGGVKDEAN